MRDPYLILNVSRETNDEAIHQAYLQAIRESPPEQDAQHFQAVRHAYETLRTEKLRLEYELFNTDLPSTTDLLQQGLSVEQKTSRPSLKAFQGLLKTGAKIAAKTEPIDP